LHDNCPAGRTAPCRSGLSGAPDRQGRSYTGSRKPDIPLAPSPPLWSNAPPQTSVGNTVAFTWVDWAIIAIIAISSLISLKRGFVKDALSLLIWIIAGAVAWMFGGSLSQYLESYIQTPSARIIAGCAILFVATLLVGAMINFLI